MPPCYVLSPKSPLPIPSPLLFLPGFFLGSLGSLGDKLTSVVTFHVLPTALSPDAITQPIWEGESQVGNARAGATGIECRVFFLLLLCREHTGM